MKERTLVFVKRYRELAYQYLTAGSREEKEQLVFTGSCHIYNMAKILDQEGQMVNHQTILWLINPPVEIGVVISRMISLGLLEYQESRERNMPCIVGLKGA